MLRPDAHRSVPRTPEPLETQMASKLATIFDKAAQWTAKQCGKAHTFAAAIAVVVVWGMSGPLFGFSDTWQLVINTGTTIITFLMVFLIQNTQNRDTQALQLKLDELIRVSAEARNRLINLEDLTEDDMDKVKQDLTRAAAKGRSDPEELEIPNT
jgi:low affinity Fe/Cu permease